jgi:hemolysin III
VDGTADVSETARVKPKYRGVSHQVTFFVTLVTGPLLVALAPNGRSRLCLVVYALALSGLFGVSALFHRRTWEPAARRRMRRLDHSMIYLAIAGTYTGLAGLALRGTARTAILIAAWVGAGVGVALKLAWLDAPKWVVATPYVLLGWMAVLAMPQLLHALGWGGVVLLVAGGLAYTLGAVVYARRRPDPSPAVFGYHEIFHAFVIAGAGLHYLTVALFALPKA